MDQVLWHILGLASSSMKWKNDLSLLPTRADSTKIRQEFLLIRKLMAWHLQTPKLSTYGRGIGFKLPSWAGPELP